MLQVIVGHTTLLTVLLINTVLTNRTPVNNILQFYQKVTLAQVFSWEYYEIFKNTYLEAHLQTTVSEHLRRSFF